MMMSQVSSRSDHQKYEKCSDTFKHEDHYVGMSENKYSFSEEFIKSLVPNVPTVIEDTMKKTLVKAIENVRNNYVQIITPKLEDGVLKFQATLGDGAKEM
eukprot:612508-Ditylum_brightwellii.AAC.1